MPDPGLFLKPTRFFWPDVISRSPFIAAMFKTRPVLAPIPFFLEVLAAARLFLIVARLLHPDTIASAIPLSIRLIVSALRRGAMMLKAGTVVSPVPSLLFSSLAPGSFLQAECVLRIQDRIQRPDNPVYVLCRGGLRPWRGCEQASEDGKTTESPTHSCLQR
jgi:hypothetical protein